MTGRKAFIAGLFLVVLLVFIPATQAAQGDGNESCLGCHGNSETAAAMSSERDIFVDPARYEASVHGWNKCSSCHPGAGTIPHKMTAFTPKTTAELCTSCHDGTVKESFKESFHGKAINMGSLKAPNCTTCHGIHDIMSVQNPASPVATGNATAICARCHVDAGPGIVSGVEHFELDRQGDGAPMWYTQKFFTWLTIIVMVLLVLHIEMELFRRLRSRSDEPK